MKHDAAYSGSGMIDSYKCSCGWESQPYFDGARYALAEWYKHKEKEEQNELLEMQVLRKS